MRKHPRSSYDHSQEPRVHPDSETLRRISVQQIQPHTKRRRLDSLDQDIYGIEIEKRPERHVGENDEGK
jgi:hypothetical protein